MYYFVVDITTVNIGANVKSDSIVVGLVVRRSLKLLLGLLLLL